MAFAHTAFQQRDDNDDSALRRSFWRKTRRVAARLPFAEDLLAAYYCAFDRATPLQVKATLVAAIAYFVLPLDAIPDVLPVLGFTDDAAVLATAIKLVASSIRPEHKEAAKDKLRNSPHPEEHRQRVRAKRGPMTGSAMRLEGRGLMVRDAPPALLTMRSNSVTAARSPCPSPAARRSP